MVGISRRTVAAEHDPLSIISGPESDPNKFEAKALRGSAAARNQRRPEASTISASRSGPPPGTLSSRVQLLPPQRVPGALQLRARERALAPSHLFQAPTDRLRPVRPDSPRSATLTQGPVGASRLPNLLPCGLGIGRSPREFESSGVAPRIVKDLMVADGAPLKRAHLSAWQAPPYYVQFVEMFAAVIVDAKSIWVEVVFMKSISTRSTIVVLGEVFRRERIPSVLFTDNGT
ncbi:hypothetical protein NDU88_007605 [Pleurodeles waltl]|uniref:Integrase catalytic domain-containing protein n=1 Tax=Pleurodeles waltl TaxID=8319 RepID=A0AAV7SSS6_PLEWA|nr:hypothetical protein NDU88_007605 [Pleurodeles waltl]